MRLKKFAFVAAALAFAVPALAETHVTPAVEPGGDIPANFHPAFAPPYPPAGDIPHSFTAPRASFR